MIINGSGSEVGSDKMAVVTAIKNARENTTRHLDISVTQDGSGELKITLPAATAGDVRVTGAATATVWLVNFDCRHLTEVSAGENTGRMMKNNHAVRDHKTIGTTLEISLWPDQLASGGSSDGPDGCAILVQSGTFGPVIGAASLLLNGAS